MGDTAIPYATKTWNVVHGCSPIAEGCRNCWAKRVAETRLRGRAGYLAEEPFRVTLNPDKLPEPLRWKKPQSVMTCSMGDLFHDQVDEKYIAKSFAMMDLARHHTYLVFTKRAERAFRLLSDEDFQFHVGWFQSMAIRELKLPDPGSDGIGPWPLKNVIMMFSASTQREVENVWQYASRVPAVMRGLSLEPLVEEVDLSDLFGLFEYDDGRFALKVGSRWANSPDWVIVGCESGPKRRYMDINWARALRDQVKAAGAAFYLKQISSGDGDTAPRTVAVHPFLDGRQWTEIPDAGLSTPVSS